MLGDREFTTEEIAQICGVSRPAVVDWISRGTLRARVTDGGHRRVARGILSEFLLMQGYRVPMTVARERPLVYVLDDEELWRKSIQTALQNDFEVETSAPAPEALLDIGERRPDVVIFDLHMPGMDTLLLMEALHDATDTLGEVLLVAVGAHDEELPLARRSGAQLALSKNRIANGDLHPLVVKLVSEHQRRPMLTA
jgi:excisionase family DNA binding protein